MQLLAPLRKLRVHIRSYLRHSPIVYALVGGLGVVLFWKGVWEMAAYVPFLFGPVSAALGMFILLVSGLLVSVFIGDKITVSEMESEKRLAERTESEIKVEENVLEHVQAELAHIESDLQKLKAKK